MPEIIDLTTVLSVARSRPLSLAWALRSEAWWAGLGGHMCFCARSMSRGNIGVLNNAALRTTVICVFGGGLLGVRERGSTGNRSVGAGAESRCR